MGLQRRVWVIWMIKIQRGRVTPGAQEIEQPVLQGRGVRKPRGRRADVIHTSEP